MAPDCVGRGRFRRSQAITKRSTARADSAARNAAEAKRSGEQNTMRAVPLLAAIKTVCDHVPSLAALGVFLGQRDEEERRLTARA